LPYNIYLLLIKHKDTKKSISKKGIIKEILKKMKKDVGVFDLYSFIVIFLLRNK